MEREKAGNNRRRERCIHPAVYAQLVSNAAGWPTPTWATSAAWMGISASKAMVRKAVNATDTTLTDIYGVGPMVAALVIGYTGDSSRFASADHCAAYNGTRKTRTHPHLTRGGRSVTVAPLVLVTGATWAGIIPTDTRLAR